MKEYNAADTMLGISVNGHNFAVQHNENRQYQYKKKKPHLNNKKHKLRSKKTMFYKNIDFKNNEIFWLGIFYTIMHGGILLIPNAVFWDDWVFYRTAPDVILDTLGQAGAMFNLAAYMHIYMLKIGPWIYKVLTFILVFLSGALLNAILKRIALLSECNRFIIVLLFLILPFNMARVALIDFGYILGVFLFLYAWHLIDRHRFIALGLFFLCFNINSLLVFYALPMLDLMYRQGYLKNHKTFFSFIYKYPDFLILPFFFYFIKVYFYSPTGLYANYNQHYSVGNIRYAIKAQIRDLASFRVNPYLLLALLPFTYAFAKSLKLQNQSGLETKSLPLFSLGFLAIILAGFPYWILGLIPTFNEWSSRHQLLFPLGTAILIVAILELFQNRIKTTILAVLISVCLSYGLVTYYSFLQDWEKQSQLLQFMERNAAKLSESNLVLFEDKTKSQNAIAREYRFYEWNGLLEQATSNEKHFGIQINELTQYQRGDFDKYFEANNKAAAHVRTNTDTPILITISLKESASYFKLLKEFEFSIASVSNTVTTPKANTE
jgi:hypothetical protein